MVITGEEFTMTGEAIASPVNMLKYALTNPIKLVPGFIFNFIVPGTVAFSKFVPLRRASVIYRVFAVKRRLFRIEGTSAMPFLPRK